MDKLADYKSMIDFLTEAYAHLQSLRADDIKEGKNINVFSLWNSFSGITEPIHSKILQFLLSPHNMHGQGNLFINLLLKRINVDFIENEEWISTAEKGRVDIMLKRYSPHSIIIIENKSNGAEDQPSQLYRYWFENIHRTNDDLCPEFYAQHQEYKILYLVPNKYKYVSSNSLHRPSYLSETMPDYLPLTPIVWSFEEEVSEWLNDCISSLPEENTPLRNLLNQYKEYCKTL